ncbi:Hypothetical predicted protein, partial [Marmota monax]
TRACRDAAMQAVRAQGCGLRFGAWYLYLVLPLGCRFRASGKLRAAFPPEASSACWRRRPNRPAQCWCSPRRCQKEKAQVSQQECLQSECQRRSDGPSAALGLRRGF